MALESGTRLGPYEILSPLGAGGMGEVYRAKDIRLDRTVAIKVLPSHLSDNARLKERFEREARAVSSLNHPHICTLHDIGSENGIDFMVMEHIGGETLADRLKKGALPLDQALRYAVEIADALDKAHRQGVVHRDLKPGNIMLTKSGTKLLDFGLATRLRQGSGAAGAAESSLPTEQKPLTEEGSILGTFQYMAPEQLEGKEADARTDIFAFGAVLYEMVTGKRAFGGKSQASLISAIMSSDPPAISTLQPLSPPLLERTARRCLEKDPDERWQTAKDLTAELRWVGELGALAEARGVDTKIGGNRGWWAWGIAAVTAFLALALAAALFMQPAMEKPVTQFAIYPPEGTTFSSWLRGKPVISPDGRFIAFSAIDDSGEKIWVRSLHSLDSRSLQGTEAGIEFFWSPDSRFIAFSDLSNKALRKADTSGGPPQILTEAYSTGGTWNTADDLLFSELWGPIYRIASAGGGSSQLTELDPSRQEVWHDDPQFLPDGDHFLFFVDSSEADFRGTYAASMSSPESRKLVLPGLKARFADPEYLLFVREGALLARRFDVKRLEVAGAPLSLVARVAMVDGEGLFSISTNNVLAYRMPFTTNAQLTWFDRLGNPLGTLQVPEGAQNPELSPDGNRMAFERRDPMTGTRDVWIYELSRGIASRFTFDSSDDSDPVWSPDGRFLIFSSSRDGHPSLYRKDPNGAGEPERIHQAQGYEDWPMSWSPDGLNVIFNRWSRESLSKLLILPLSGDSEPAPLLGTNFQELQGQFSPDGKWMSYASNESGRYEVYVQAFPPTGKKWQISTEGGTDGRWRGDGREIYYIGPDRALMAVELNPSGASIRPSTPRRLFQTRFSGPYGAGVRFGYAVSSDGERFLIDTDVGETRSAPIIVVLNWTGLLE